MSAIKKAFSLKLFVIIVLCCNSAVLFATKTKKRPNSGVTTSYGRVVKQPDRFKPVSDEEARRVQQKKKFHQLQKSLAAMYD